MEVLTNSLTMFEICRKFNVASFALYKRMGKLKSTCKDWMEHGRFTVETSLRRKITEHEGIIGEMINANEILKKIQVTRSGGMP